MPACLAPGAWRQGGAGPQQGSPASRDLGGRKSERAGVHDHDRRREVGGGVGDRR